MCKPPGASLEPLISGQATIASQACLLISRVYNVNRFFVSVSSTSCSAMIPARTVVFTNDSTWKIFREVDEGFMFGEGGVSSPPASAIEVSSPPVPAINGSAPVEATQEKSNQITKYGFINFVF